MMRRRLRRQQGRRFEPRAVGQRGGGGEARLAREQDDVLGLVLSRLGERGLKAARHLAPGLRHDPVVVQIVVEHLRVAAAPELPDARGDGEAEERQCDDDNEDVEGQRLPAKQHVERQDNHENEKSETGRGEAPQVSGLGTSRERARSRRRDHIGREAARVWRRANGAAGAIFERLAARAGRVHQLLEADAVDGRGGAAANV
mmetsp:Transcript_41973/g.104063  ORF Transcript_41973/g.104063 Transcript_41973/m.104063 type:complete len:202 (+) Transcript_41973:319-924(+)